MTAVRRACVQKGSTASNATSIVLAIQTTLTGEDRLPLKPGVLLHDVFPVSFSSFHRSVHVWKVESAERVPPSGSSWAETTK